MKVTFLQSQKFEEIYNFLNFFPILWGQKIQKEFWETTAVWLHRDQQGVINDTNPNNKGNPSKSHLNSLIIRKWIRFNDATMQQEPGDSSRDLFIPQHWRSLNHLKGSLNHPKKVTKNCQEWYFFIKFHRCCIGSSPRCSCETRSAFHRWIWTEQPRLPKKLGSIQQLFVAKCHQSCAKNICFEKNVGWGTVVSFLNIPSNPPPKVGIFGVVEVPINLHFPFEE